MTPTATSNTPWPTVKLGDVCEVKAGATHHPVQAEDGAYPVFGSGGYICQATEFRCPANTVTVGRKGTLDKPLLIEEPFWNIDTCFGVIPGEEIEPRYLWHFCQNFDFYHLVPSLGRPSTNSDAIKNISIPLPPLEVQREIVAKVEKGLEEADALAAHFKRLAALADETFKAELDETFQSLSAPTVKLGDVCETTSGGTPLRSMREYYEGGNIPWLRSGEVCQKDIKQTEMFITQQGVDNSSAKLLPIDTIVVAMYGATAGQVGILRLESTTNQAVCGILPSCKYMPEFLYYQLLSMKDVMVAQAQGGAQPNISQIKIKNLIVTFPPLAEQERIVEKLEAVKAKCERLKAEAERGVKAAEALRKAVLAEAFER